MNQTETPENHTGIADAENEVEPLKNMKPLRARTSCRAFTKVDLLIIGAILLFLFVQILPHLLVNTGRGSKRIECVNNLKQIELAFQIWAYENNDSFPMAVSINAGGTMEYVQTPEVFRHLQVMSNEVSQPRRLLCPSDKRKPANSFTNLSNQNLSYFVGLDATGTNPRSILSGDRNLTHNGKLISSLFPITTNTVLGWSSSIHKHAGNIAMGDGSVQQVTSNGLASIIQNSGGPNRLHMP